jgi:hypothetical protein
MRFSALLYLKALKTLKALRSKKTCGQLNFST